MSFDELDLSGLQQGVEEMEERKKTIANLKTRKESLEDALKCDGILNYGPILNELKEINDALKEINENEMKPVWKPCRRTYKELF